jgi:hypothetical protein
VKGGQKICRKAVVSGQEGVKSGMACWVQRQEIKNLQHNGIAESKKERMPENYRKQYCRTKTEKWSEKSQKT